MAITIDDFAKVWASQSPLTPYEFSESQYKEGWNFVGATPPSRQMWDFLQKNNDEKMQYLLNHFDNYLPLSGGTLTGVVDGVTPTAGDNSTKIATTEFVNAKAGNYLPLSGGTLTGVVDGVTPTAGDNSTKIATTEFVNAKAGNYLPLSGGTLTGVVNGVTPTPGDDTTKLATTAYVQGELTNYLPLSGGTLTGGVDITGDLSVSGAIYSSDPASGENSGQVPTTAWVQKLLANEYGSPFTAATAADMTDTSKIYVYVGNETGYTNGNWYYYDGSAWVSGGVYNSTAFETDKTLTISGAAADAKATGNLIEDSIGLVDIDELTYTPTEGKKYGDDGTVSDSTTYSITSLIDVSDYEKIKIQANNLAIYLFAFKSNGTTVHSYSGWYTEREYVKNAGVKYIAMTVRHPQGQKQVSPTTDEIADNIRVVAIKRGIPAIDATLTISGDAADSKAVGDGFGLQDIEIGATQDVIGLSEKSLSVTQGKAYDFSGNIKDSTTYSIIAEIPLGQGRKSVKFTTNGYGIYYLLLNSTGEVASANGWHYNGVTMQLGGNVVGVVCTVRKPIAQKQVSPTTAEILKNIKVYEIAETNLAERIKYLPSPLFPVAKSTRYVYSKGKMWEYNWNTAEAFTAAGKDDRCWGISGDVRVTADGYFVCFHDATVDAQTDGTGAIEDKTWAQVQEINVDKGVWDGSSWTGQSDGRTCKIPLLSDFLKICRKYGKVALIETKAAGSTAIGNLSSANIDDIVAMIRNMGMENSCAFIVPKSNYTYLYNNYRQLCRFKLYDGNLTASEINTYAYDYNIVFGAWNSALTESLISLAHQNRLYIAGYTPRTNPVTDDVAMVEKGLDVVFLFREPPEII